MYGADIVHITDTLRQDFGMQVHMQTELSAELEQQVMAVLVATVYREW